MSPITALRGIVPPLVTPLAGPDELDAAAVVRLIDHVLAAPVADLFVLGTTGEGPNLSHRLQRELIARGAAGVRGGVRVRGETPAPPPGEGAAPAGPGAGAGGAAVVAAPPYY